MNSEEIPAQRDAIQGHLKGVSLNDIYNMDKTGLFTSLCVIILSSEEHWKDGIIDLLVGRSPVMQR